MTSLGRVNWISRRLRIAVGQRLLLGLAPSLLAVALVPALAYYGEIGREAPQYVVGVAAALAAVSLMLTWWNSRYLSRRLRRLGTIEGVTSAKTSMDDLDRIEAEVARLAVALATSQREGVIDHQQLEGRLHEQATMLAATLRGISAQIDEVRLPLHILLDARFGELNENQEELLVAARDGANAMDAAVRRLGVVVDVDRKAIAIRLEPVAPNDVVRAILPMVRSTAERLGFPIDIALEPALPRVWANRAALAESLALIATIIVEHSTTEETVVISTRSDRQHCYVEITPLNQAVLDEPLTISARRLLQAQEASMSYEGRAITISLPRALA